MSENLKDKVGLATLGGHEPEVQVVTLDSKDIGTELSNKREPDILPAGSFQELPEAFNWAIKKLDSNPEITAKIIHLLTGVVTKLGQSSVTFELFTQAVRPPQSLDQELMALIGIPSSDSLKRAAIKIGFSQENSMHMDPYYIILLFLFYYGCKIDNKLLRQLCIIMIFVKLYRGRIYKFWKNGSDETTVRYVISHKLRATNIAKLYPNTFDAIISVWAPRLDTKYWETVRNHPAHPLRGMLSILVAGRTRLHQAYVGLARHYYEAFNAGYKTGSNKTDEEMVERNSLSQTQLYSEAVYNNLIYSHTPVSDMDREFIRDTLKLSQVEISKFEDYIRAPEHAEEVKQTLELFIQLMKPESTQDIANFNISMAANTITSARAKNSILKLKDRIDNSIRIVYGNNILGASPAQVLKIRKCYVLLYLLKIKQTYSKRSYYFERNIIEA